MRSGLSERIGKLERCRTYVPVKPMSKMERDEIVRAALLGGDIAAFLAVEPKAERRAAIDAAFRADH